MKSLDDFLGMCPKCHEWTTAGESCCGRGAWVEGDLVSDESAIDAIENPTKCVVLMCGRYDELKEVHSYLHSQGVRPMLSGVGDVWTLRIFIPVAK